MLSESCHLVARDELLDAKMRHLRMPTDCQRAFPKGPACCGSMARQAREPGSSCRLTLKVESNPRLAVLHIPPYRRGSRADRSQATLPWPTALDPYARGFPDEWHQPPLLRDNLEYTRRVESHPVCDVGGWASPRQDAALRSSSVTHGRGPCGSRRWARSGVLRHLTVHVRFVKDRRNWGLQAPAAGPAN